MQLALRAVVASGAKSGVCTACKGHLRGVAAQSSQAHDLQRVEIVRQVVWWLRILFGLAAGAAAIWLAVWGLVLLANRVPLAVVLIAVIAVVWFLETRRQRRADDPIRNVEAFLRWERVQILMERLREGRARRRLEELRRAGHLPSE